MGVILGSGSGNGSALKIKLEYNFHVTNGKVKLITAKTMLNKLEVISDAVPSKLVSTN